jgi:pimeloyl-ACP methyl ester carboxylesterase
MASGGESMKKRRMSMETAQNEMDIIAMIPDWSLGLEILASIAIMVVSAILKDFVVSYIGAWLLALGSSLDMAKEINGLKEDLWSPDLEKRRAAMEKVELDKQVATICAVFLLVAGFTIAFSAMPGSVTFPIVAMVLLLISYLPILIVHGQADKVMPPEPEKAAKAAP